MPLQPFPPELMMRHMELAKARCLLRGLEHINQQSRLDEALPKLERKGYGHFAKRIKTAWLQMDALAAEVWKREVRLERYSVIQARREDMEFRLQVLAFSFMDHFGQSGCWAWRLEGRALRKDGTLGSASAYAVFRSASVQRRHLDGAWRELRWLNEESA